MGKGQPMKQGCHGWWAYNMSAIGELCDGETGEGDKVRENRLYLICIFLLTNSVFAFF